MIVVLAGCFAFIPFFLYDFLKLSKKHRFHWLLYVLGLLILLGSTVLLIRFSFSHAHALTFPCLFVAALFFVLEVYSLFIELPVQAVYLKFAENTVVNTGTYALCRHPAVLWLGFVYLFLVFALPSLEMIAAFLCFTALNVSYALFEERVVFIKTISGYERYMQTTPQLIPTRTSLMNCLKTLNPKRKDTATYDV